VRICFVGNAHSIHLQRWVHYFLSKGHEITLACPGYDPSRADTELLRGASIHVSDWGLKRPFTLRHRLASRREWLRLRLFLRSLAPDLVHVHYISASSSVFFFWRLRNLVISTWGSDIVYYGGEGPEARRARFYKRFLLSQAEVITATSHYLARVTAQYAPPGRRIHVVPFGVDCGIFKPVKRKERQDDFVVGFVKHLEPKYGPEYLIRAMRRVVDKHPRARLLMVGSGSMREELEALVDDLGLRSRVIFTGAIPHKDVPRTLAKMDILAMPSIHDAFGVAALEAQAMEVPVVATRVGGIPEVVEDGMTGVLVEPRNVEQLAQAIIGLLEDPDLRMEMGRKGREYVLAHYQWKENAAEMEEIYVDVVAAL